MSYYDGLTPAYTYRLCIEREDRVIIETAITAKAEPGEIAKAKKDLKRLLDAYSPTFPAPAAPAPDIPTPPEAEDHAEDQQLDNQAEAAAPPPRSAAPLTRDRPDGAKGLLRLYCPECGNTFGTFLREYQTEVACKCGHQIDLTGQLGRFRFICPYCQHEGWGKTNSEEPEIETRCKCGEDVTMRWNPDAREYQN